MTSERTEPLFNPPDGFAVCGECGALVSMQDEARAKHDNFHARVILLERRRGPSNDY